MSGGVDVMKLVSSWDALLAAPAPCDHLVQLHTSDEALISTVARFIERGVAEGEGVVAITTAPHSRMIEARLSWPTACPTARECERP
jgi:hypothetical protein